MLLFPLSFFFLNHDNDCTIFTDNWSQRNKSIRKI